MRNTSSIPTVVGHDIRRVPLLSGLLMLLAVVASENQATEQTPPQLYEVVTETGMPHLEESLRYTSTRQQHCLRRQQLFSLFPLLRSRALAGCRLDGESRRDAVVTYVLTCKPQSETSGTVTWHVGKDAARGQLNVKLGGKNMTVYQRVWARPMRGTCQ